MHGLKWPINSTRIAGRAGELADGGAGCRAVIVGANVSIWRAARVTWATLPCACAVPVGRVADVPAACGAPLRGWDTTQ